MGAYKSMNSWFVIFACHVTLNCDNEWSGGEFWGMNVMQGCVRWYEWMDGNEMKECRKQNNWAMDRNTFLCPIKKYHTSILKNSKAEGIDSIIGEMLKYVYGWYIKWMWICLR